MADFAAHERLSGLRWPFPERDAFAAVPAEHRLRVIHSLPGMVVWPILLLMFVTILPSMVAYWGVAGDGEGAVAPSGTVFFVAVTVFYVLLALIFHSWLATQEIAGRVFQLLPRSFSEIGAAALVFIAGLTIGGQLSLMFYEFAAIRPEGAGIPDDISNVDEILGHGGSAWAIALAVVIAAPILEEALFRGWMLPMLVARGVPWIFAIIISALAFGLMHIFQGLQVMAYTAILGFFLGFARMATGRVAAPVLAHIVNNAWAVFIGPWIFIQFHAG